MSEQTKNLLVLSTVPMVWGTYVPVVRSMYGIIPPVPGFVFSASYLTVASLTCLAMLAVKGDALFGRQKSKEGGDAAAQGGGTSPDKVLLLGGLELGMYTFIANSLQVVGLETVPSGRAGFLIQRKFSPMRSSIVLCSVQYQDDVRSSVLVIRTQPVFCLGLQHYGIFIVDSNNHIRPFGPGGVGGQLVVGASKNVGSLPTGFAWDWRHGPRTGCCVVGN